MIPVGLDKPLIRRPYVTLGLMALNCLVFVMQLDSKEGRLTYALSFVPGHACLLTLFSHMFVHADFAHLLGNMFFFAVAGLKTEDALGHWRFLLFYLGCGVAANLAHTSLSGSVPVAMMGASGAIAGVLGGFMVLYPFNNVRLLYVFFIGVIFKSGVFELPVVAFFGFWIAREIFYLVASLGGNSFGGIAFGAHVGGFIAGAVWAWAFYGWNAGDRLDDAAFDQETAPVYVSSDYEAYSRRDDA